MLLSEMIQRLREVQAEHGDIRVTCTVIDSTHKDSHWGEELIAIDLNDENKEDLYCDIFMAARDETQEQQKQIKEA